MSCNSFSSFLSLYIPLTWDTLDLTGKERLFSKSKPNKWTTKQCQLWSGARKMATRDIQTQLCCGTTNNNPERMWKKTIQSWCTTGTALEMSVRFRGGLFTLTCSPRNSLQTGQRGARGHRSGGMGSLNRQQSASLDTTRFSGSPWTMRFEEIKGWHKQEPEENTMTHRLIEAWREGKGKRSNERAKSINLTRVT